MMEHVERAAKDAEDRKPGSGRAAQGFRVEQLRGDIDAGRTGDKVAYPDPAAAPLGADDEAAGNPVPPDGRARQGSGRLSAASMQARRASAMHQPPAGISHWAIGAAVLIVALMVAGLALI